MLFIASKVGVKPSIIPAIAVLTPGIASFIALNTAMIGGPNCSLNWVPNATNPGIMSVIANTTDVKAGARAVPTVIAASLTALPINDIFAFSVSVFAANSSCSDVLSSNPCAAVSKFVASPSRSPPNPFIALPPSSPNNFALTAERSRGSSISPNLETT